MKKALITISLSAALLQGVTGTALADPSFSKSYDTGRVQMVEYSDNLVVKVIGHLNQTIAIEFPKGETLIATHGASQVNWTGVGIGDRAFLRPGPDPKTGSFFIITDQHTYVFDLVPAYKGTSRADRVSKIMFVKPESKAPGKEESVDVRSKGENFSYSMEVVDHSVDIRPTEVFDDGTFTYFKFPRHAEIPAIYKGALDTKEEWLINKHNENDYVVIHGVSPQWNLRLGNALVGIFNESFNRHGSGVQHEQ